MDKKIEVKQTFLKQIKQYLDGEITRKMFGDIAELYYDENVKFIEGTKFCEIYTEIIPDACLVYIDEPWDEDEKEKCFHRELVKAYNILTEIDD